MEARGLSDALRPVSVMEVKRKLAGNGWLDQQEHFESRNELIIAINQILVMRDRR